MAAVAPERVVNGIKTRLLHGKDYVEVAERVRIVQHDEQAQGYSMISQERYEWNGRHFMSITIEVKGKRYIGDAEVTFSAPKNTPAGMSPVETAQTSALGRALAFAGYGTVESIASFDEVYRNVTTIEEANTPRVVEASNRAVLPPASKQKVEMATEQQMEALRKLCKRLGQPEPENTLPYEEAKTKMVELTKLYQERRQSEHKAEDPEPSPVQMASDEPANSGQITEQQKAAIRKLCVKLGNRKLPPNLDNMMCEHAANYITQLNTELLALRKQPA